MTVYLYPNRLNQFKEGEVALLSAEADSFVAEVDFQGKQTSPRKYTVGDLIQVGEEYWQVVQILQTVSTGLRKIRQGDKKPVAEVKKVDALAGEDWVY